MTKNDGTGMGNTPPEKQASSAFEDAAAKGSKSSGAGEGGTGGQNETGRTSPVHGGK
jgi:hypothetical protein